jgi:hypothetical protein
MTLSPLWMRFDSCDVRSLIIYSIECEKIKRTVVSQCSPLSPVVKLDQSEWFLLDLSLSHENSLELIELSSINTISSV